MLRPAPFGALLAHSVHLAARVLVVGVALAVVMANSRPALAQSPPVQVVPLNAKAWVHPTDGVDPAPGNPAAAFAYIDDPSLKFKSLQTAIDTVLAYLIANYDAVDNPDQQGIVYALPGLYGPHGTSTSSNDNLPILMRDRVHVQGVGARRCVIRGASTVSTPVAGPYTVSFPLQASNSGNPGVGVTPEILVSYRFATPDDKIVLSGPHLPWFLPSSAYFPQEFDSPEVLDGFGLQGGDVQVLLTYPASAAYYFSAARISNCLFDLRHNWSPTGDATVALAGPFFGIMMQRPVTYESGTIGAPVGYLDGRTLIAHNTFVFARWGDTADNDGWESESRPETVGIIDFTFTSCGFIPDPDDRFRGVGNPCITSNVFRTRPAPSGATVLPFAMLGIGDEDTRAKTVTGYIQTNAFDPARVGSTNNYFWSLPVASSMVDFTGGIGKWNCQVSPIGGACGTQSNPCSAIATPTQPAAPIWDGSNGLDPAFVGEYIATSTALVDYRDWLLLPGSPLENLGYMPPPGGPRAFITSPHVDSQGVSDPTWHFPFDWPEELNLFQWDGEHWGNPRVVDGAPDIGFDERGLLICAGNWANDSNSHNQAVFMQPGVTPGSSTRYFILPDSAGGVALNAPNRSLRVYQSILTPPSPPATGNGWINPPLSLANPPSSSALPLYYRTKYVAFTQALPWPDQLLLPALGQYSPLGGATPQVALSFRLVSQIDDECSPPPCTESYFNMQAIVLETSSSNVLLRSNMQGEYR